MRQIVNGLLLSDGHVLLARRSPARKTYPDLWSFPGGHVEPGETLIEALHRELKEEIGIVPAEIAPITAFEDPNTELADPVAYHLYRIDLWHGTPIIQDQEHTQLCWFAFAAAAELPNLALEGYRSVFLTLHQSEAGGIDD
jgi:8-oxo-dGTP diphosphatase